MPANAVRPANVFLAIACDSLTQAWDARPSRVRPAMEGRSSGGGLDAREVFSGNRQMCIRLESSAKKARVRKTIRAAITRNAATVQTNAGIRTWIAPQTIKINGMRL